FPVVSRPRPRPHKTFSLNKVKGAREARLKTTSRIEFDPMSTTATRPDAARFAVVLPFGAMAGKGSGLAQRQVRRLLRPLERAAAPRQTRIDHEVGVRTERIDPGSETGIASVGLECPALHVVLQICDHDLIEDLLMDGRILDRHQGLDAVVEIARHPVRRGDEDLGRPRRQAGAGAEADDARMLEKAADDALDANGLGEARDPRTQAANAAHDQVDAGPGLGSPVS